MGWAEYEAHAAGQWYVARISAAAEFGLSPHTVWRTARKRGWDPRVPGIVWFPGPETPERWMMTGQLLVGENGAITDWTALYATGYIDKPPSKVHLVVPYGHGIPSHSRLAVRRSRTLAAPDLRRHDDFTLTTMERTLCQMAGKNALATLRGYALDGRRRGDMTVDELRQTITCMGNFPGLRKMEHVVEQIDGEEADSVLEFAMRRRLESAGFTPDAEQFKLRTPTRLLKLDIPWREYRVGLECDSLKHHGTRAGLHRDAVRHNSAHDTDWVILRATWTHLDDDAAFAELCGALRRALRRGAHASP